MLNELFAFSPLFVSLFWAIVLLWIPDATQAYKKILGYFMAACLGIYGSHAVYFQELKTAYWVFDVLYQGSALIVYPFFYLYLRSLTRNELISRKDWKFFMPSLGLTLLTLLLYLFMSPEQRLSYVDGFLYGKAENMDDILLRVQSFLYILGRFIYSLQVIIFFIMGSALLQMYEAKILNFYSYLEGKRLTWANYLNYTYFAAALLSISFTLIGKSTFIAHNNLLFIPSILFTALLFLIGFQGNIQHSVWPGLRKAEERDDIKHPVSDKEVDDELEEKLVHLFSVERIYLKTDLKITDVSKKLLTNRTYISHFINSTLGISFNTYVNQFRVKEAMQLIASDINHELRQEDIAEQSGFGSLKSYQRAFKEHTGKSPMEYRKMQVEKMVATGNP
jgi:AraC-like DNA-binding protein